MELKPSKSNSSYQESKDEYKKAKGYEPLKLKNDNFDYP